MAFRIAVSFAIEIASNFDSQPSNPRRGATVSFYRAILAKVFISLGYLYRSDLFGRSISVGDALLWLHDCWIEPMK